VSNRRKPHGFGSEASYVCHLHELAPRKLCAQRPSRRVHVSSELSSKRPLATPLTRMASAKTLNPSRPFCNHQAVRFCKAEIELTVKHATSPCHVMLCYVCTNAREWYVQPAMLPSQPLFAFSSSPQRFASMFPPKSWI
jgi:hypothetical protein